MNPTESELVDENTVIKQLALQMLHNRGEGANFTYEESTDNLNTVIELEPDTLEELANEFVASHHSQLGKYCLNWGNVCVLLNTVIAYSV